MDLPGPLPERRADAVAARVAAADDHDVLALGRDPGGRRRGRIAGHEPVLLGQEVHGEVDVVEGGTRNAQASRLARPHRQQDRVEVPPQVARGEILPHHDAGLELHPFRVELAQAAIDDPLLQLEVRDPVAEQAADPVVLLEDHDVVSDPGQLLGGGQTGRARAHDRHPLAGPQRRRPGLHPTLCKRALGDLVLDVLDQHRVVVDAQRAGRLTRRRTDPAGDLREVVGRVQVLARLAPLASIDQIVELGNAVLHRAARCGRRECRSPCSAPPAGPASLPGAEGRLRRSPRPARPPDDGRSPRA